MQPRSRSEVWALLPAELSIIDNTENNMASIITIKHRHRRHIPTIRQDKDLPVNKVNRVEMNGRNRNRTMKTTTFSIKMLEMARMTTTKPVQNSIRVKTNSSNLSVHTGAAIPIKWTRNNPSRAVFQCLLPLHLWAWLSSKSLSVNSKTVSLRTSIRRMRSKYLQSQPRLVRSTLI